MGDALEDTETNHAADDNNPVLRPRKRRRTRKACDDCRRRKVKCDGALPCKSCRDFGDECTYKRSEKRKSIGPQYVDNLEESVHRLKSILSKVFPDRDVDHPLFETSIEEQLDSAREKLHAGTKSTTLNLSHTDGDSRLSDLKNDDLLDTMIEFTGHLNIDGRGRCNFQGDFGGLSFLRRIGERCNQLLDTNSLKRNMSSQLPLPQAGGSARSLLYPARVEPITTCMLPSEAAAIRLTRITFEDACCLMKFMHQPSFDRLLHRVYNMGAENYTSEEESFLPLLYMTLAIGSLFSPVQEGHQTQQGSTDKIRGAKYFRAAETLLDIMDCNDMHSLQTLVCMVIYLQAAALMHSCYTYISVAIASALRMGLHRSTTSTLLDPIQQETRRRVFWVLRTMETYVTTLLGIPLIINDNDVDQPLPLEIDDRAVTENGITNIQRNSGSPMAVANAHTKLIIIMRRVIRDIYPHRKDLDGYHGCYRVNYARVTKVEADLDDWFRNIPQPSLDQPVPLKMLRIQLLLRLAYAHVQMVLYRPFIHHIVRTQANDPPEIRSYACASACIKAAMQVIWLIEEMEIQGVFHPSDWFLCYMTFFAVMSLCIFILGNTNDMIIDDAVAAAEKGRKILEKIASKTQCAICSTSVDTLLDRMSLHWGKRARAHTAKTDDFKQDLDTADKGASLSTEAGNATELNTTSAPTLPSFAAECGIASDPLAGFSGSHNEQEQLELLAMIYPIAGSFPFDPELSMPHLPDSSELSSGGLYAPYHDTTQFDHNLGNVNHAAAFI